MKILEMFASGKIGVTDIDPGSCVVCELSNNFINFGHDVTIADVKSNQERNLLDPRVKVFEANLPSPHINRKLSKLGVFINRMTSKILPYFHRYGYFCDRRFNSHPIPPTLIPAKLTGTNQPFVI